MSDSNTPGYFALPLFKKMKQDLDAAREDNANLAFELGQIGFFLYK